MAGESSYRPRALLLRRRLDSSWACSIIFSLKKFEELILYAPKGGGVHPLKSHASWVKYGASQYGLNLPKVSIA